MDYDIPGNSGSLMSRMPEIKIFSFHIKENGKLGKSYKKSSSILVKKQIELRYILVVY
jgi:hypothetical protein